MCYYIINVINASDVEAEFIASSKGSGKDRMGDTEITGSASDDKELVEKLKRAEPTAVVELYNLYFDRIYSLVFNQLARDREATQDIVQETFLAALKSASRFRGQSKVYTWLYSIASKKVADFYRHRTREAKRQNESLERYATSLSPNGTLESEEKHQLVQTTLSRLPWHYRQVLLLKYVEEMPVSEISQVMERSPKSVEGLLTRARRELRNNLTTPGEG